MLEMHVAALFCHYLSCGANGISITMGYGSLALNFLPRVAQGSKVMSCSELLPFAVRIRKS